MFTDQSKYNLDDGDQSVEDDDSDMNNEDDCDDADQCRWKFIVQFQKIYFLAAVTAPNASASVSAQSHAHNQAATNLLLTSLLPQLLQNPTAFATALQLIPGVVNFLFVLFIHIFYICSLNKCRQW
jgi:hypothetical protein